METSFFIDASLIKVYASKNSVFDKKDISRYLNKEFMELEDKDTSVNRTRVSTTDPEASIVRRCGKGPEFCYKTHRGVDPLNEVITSTPLKSGNVDDGAVLFDMKEIHEKNTETEVDTVVADSKCGTKNNYLKFNDSGIQAHIPSLEKTQNHGDIFPKEAFIYNPELDTFTCPAGHVLVKKRFHKKMNAYDYEPARGILFMLNAPG
jgi:hypothetical protein